VDVLVVAVAVVAALLVGGSVGFLLQKKFTGVRAEADTLKAESLLEDAQRDADALRKEAELEAKELQLRVRQDTEEQLELRRSEVARAEERAGARDEQLDQKNAELTRREQGISDREVHARTLQDELKATKDAAVRELERASGMTQSQAREQLLKETEDDVRHDMAKMIRRVEEEAKQESDRRVRTIISTGIGRLAASHAAATTVSMVELASDDMKGRIIGREGRNIRALETITGCDVIIDDTPGMVILSGFDGVRREIGRLTLEKLIADGRIHPSRIEEMYYQAKAEIEEKIVQAGEQASFEANVPGLHPELIKVLGRLNYRTSYGQNVLRHSLECAHLAAMMAAEMGADQKVARRAALLHDIGKAVTHEVEGSHAIISGQLCKKHGESAAVVHAVESHHFDVEPQTVEAVLVQAADAISAARPGARGESLENYVKRLEALEAIAMGKKGVEKCFAMQAGRDLRVMVKPEEIDDDAATLLVREIAKEIEASLEYPGQIKVTVIRESRATEFAK
jgi:ribonuclease Y